ncbi:hypothetical protein [Pseudomonas aeruginosa]|uniref:hypothetical protein n=1 Tax=Pseudomonas aeruginosa TaxID=287 RepID=UPI002F4264B2
MATVTHVLSGAGAPAAAPPSVGAHYVNTTNGDQYLAKGTASAADWVKLGGGAAGSASEVLHVVEGENVVGPQHALVDVFLDDLPASGLAIVGFDPSSSCQFDLRLRTASPNGQNVRVRRIDDEGIDGGDIHGAASPWSSVGPGGMIVSADALNGEVWSRVYYDHATNRMDVVVFTDTTAT